jgi:hypothetical protein
LSAVFNRHVPKDRLQPLLQQMATRPTRRRPVSKDRLQPLLQQMEAQQRIIVGRQKNNGRTRTVIALRCFREECELSELSEKREFSEKRGAAC